jgi:hypothetical protein
MKRLVFFLLLIGLSACEFYYLDPVPVYDNRDSVIGRYDVDEYSETFNDHVSYSVYIKLGRYSDEIYIDNFYDVNVRVHATLVGGRITIRRQTINGYEIEGVGTIYGGEIDFHYSVRDHYSNVSTDFCEATYYRW